MDGWDIGSVQGAEVAAASIARGNRQRASVMDWSPRGRVRCAKLFSQSIVIPWQNKAIDQQSRYTQSASSDYKAKTTYVTNV